MARITRRLQFAASPGGQTSPFSITSVTPSNNQITVTWDGYPGATGYRVARDGVDTGGGGPWTGDLAANERSWTALYLVNGDTYNLTVQPLPNGPVASVSAVAGTTGAAQISSFSATVASNTQINLSWSYSGATLTNYTLRRGGTVIASPAAGATSYNDTGLTAGTTYSYTLTGNLSAGGTTNTASVSRTTSGGASAAGNLGAMVFVSESSFDQDLAETVAAGFTWIRMDIPNGSYGTLNTSNGTFTRNTARSNFYKQACQKAKDAGLKICMDMAAFNNDSSWSDATYAQYNANVVRAVSQDIGQHVDLWQFFNEHDGNDFRTQQASGATTAYFARLRDALAVLRSAAQEYSSAPVTTTTFGYPINQARYDRWQSFWDVVNPAADVIGVHGYPEGNQTTINLLATYMTNLKNRYSKPVCILEFGVPKVSGYGTPTQIGDAIVRQIAAIMSVNPACAALYQLRDRGTNPNDTNGEMVFGILENNWAKKSYYNAVVAEVQKWD